MSDWRLVYEGFDPGQERLREALCTLGNGYFATRGAAEESPADDAHYPGCYVAGCYNRLGTGIAGRTIVNEDLVNVPNWLPLTFRPEGGDWFHPGRAELLSYRQELDMRHGVLSRDLRFRDAAGRVTRVTSRRLVHMLDPHVAALEYVVIPESWSGRVRVRSLIDGSVVNSGVARYRSLNSRHLEVLDREVAGESEVYLLPDDHARAASLPLPSPSACALDGEAGRIRRGDVPLAEREQRPGGDPAPAPQPPRRDLGRRREPPAAPRERRHRLQRLAVPRGHGRPGVPLALRCRDDPRDRTLLREPGAVRRGSRSLRSGLGSLLGRLLGTAAKLGIAVVMAALFLWWAIRGG